MEEWQERLCAAIESLAESQLRIEKDTKDTNKQLIDLANRNAGLLKDNIPSKEWRGLQ